MSGDTSIQPKMASYVSILFGYTKGLKNFGWNAYQVKSMQKKNYASEKMQKASKIALHQNNLIFKHCS